MIDLNGDAQHAEPDRAITRAIAASGAQNVAELFRVDRELVQDTLALARVLRGTWIVAGSVHRERRELARIPAPHTRVAGCGPGVQDVEAMARGACESARAATHASERVFLPERILEMVGDERANLLGVKFLFGTRRNVSNLIRFLCLAAEKSAAFVRKTSDFTAAAAQIE